MLESRQNSKLRKLESFIGKVEREFTEIYIAGAEAVKKKRVRKYIFRPSGKIFWTVLGKEGNEYLVTEWNSSNNIIYACSCPDYLFHAMLKTRADNMVRRNFCYHIIARVISELNELKKELKHSFNDYALPNVIYLNDNEIKDFLRRFLK